MNYGEPAPARRQWALAVAAVSLITLFATWRKVASWDLWWHLAIGREAVATRSTVPLDSFSWSFAGAPYVHKDLGADLVFFAAFDQLSWFGLTLIQCVAVLAGLGGLALAMGRRAQPAAWVLLASLLLAANLYRIIPRPLVFTEGFFILALGLIERARGKLLRGDTRAFARAMLPLVPLLWLWLNLHRGGLVGLVLLLGLTLDLLLAQALARVPRVRCLTLPAPGIAALGVAALATLGAVLAGLLNPSGIKLYTSGLAVSHDPIHRSMISEWQPLTRDLALSVHWLATLLIAAAWLGALVWLVRRLLAPSSGSSTPDAAEEALPPSAQPTLTLWHLGVLGLFTVQGVASMRWLTHAVAAAVIILALLVGNWIQQRKALKMPRGSLALATLLGLLLVGANQPHEFGQGLSTHRYPVGALLEADRLQLGPKIHNSFEYGGYAIWASHGRRQVLIDGRNDMVYPSEFFLRCARAQRDPQLFAQLREELTGDWVLADNTPGRESFGFLSNDPAWWMLYWSEEAVIYVPREAHAELEAQAFQYLRANDLMGSLRAALQAAGNDTDRVQAIGHEVERMLEASPESIRANVLLALWFHSQGPAWWEPRDAVLEFLRELAPEHPAVVELRRRFGF